MPHHAMTPHISGTSLSAQARYAAGVREVRCHTLPPRSPPARRRPPRARRPAAPPPRRRTATPHAKTCPQVLECYFAQKPLRDTYQIVTNGQLAGVGAHSYSAGTATGGSEDAVGKVKK